jgi:hypothetical protein
MISSHPDPSLGQGDAAAESGDARASENLISQDQGSWAATTLRASV